MSNITDNSEDELVVKQQSFVEFAVEEEIVEVIYRSEPQQPKSFKDIEEVKKQNSALKSSIIGEEPEELPVLDLNWTMFEKGSKLGEGANGTVYKVKALKTSIFSSDHGGRIELNNPELMKRYGST